MTPVDGRLHNFGLYVFENNDWRAYVLPWFNKAYSVFLTGIPYLMNTRDRANKIN